LDIQLFYTGIDEAPPQCHNDKCFVSSRDKRLIACAKDENVALYEARTGQKIASFDASPMGQINCVLFGNDSRTLITGSSNTTIHVWDWIAAAKLRSDAKARPTAAAWNDLADDDPSRAYRTIHMLVQHPDEALPLLRERLKPATGKEAIEDRNSIAALDHARFSVRDKARRALLLRGEDALPQLDAAMKERLSPEAENAVKGLIAAMPVGGSREGTRQVRAIQVLDWLNTSASRQLLRELADGDPNALRTREAAKALRRIEEIAN